MQLFNMTRPHMLALIALLAFVAPVTGCGGEPDPVGEWFLYSTDTYGEVDDISDMKLVFRTDGGFQMGKAPGQWTRSDDGKIRVEIQSFISTIVWIVEIDGDLGTARDIKGNGKKMYFVREGSGDEDEVRRLAAAS